MEKNSAAILIACEHRIKKAGLRLTSQRSEVIKCLLKAPASVIELVNKLEKNSKVDRVTVYRIIESFAELGIVHMILPEGRYAICSHVGCCHTHHLLARCSVCGKHSEIDIPEKVFKPLQEHLKKVNGFKASDMHFQLDGTCKSCQA